LFFIEIKADPKMFLIIVAILFIVIFVLINKKEKPRTIIPNDATVEEILEKLNKDIFRLIDYINEKYSQRCGENIKFKDYCLSNYVSRDVKQILKRLKHDPDNLIEHIPEKGNDLTAYNENKGDEIGICMKYMENGEIKMHDYNTIMFVTLHELSHMITPNHIIGHPEQFWKYFAYLINDAIELGIYTPVEYDTNNVKYCNIAKNMSSFQGINISYNPYNDPKFTPLIKTVKKY
jgi:hypothetical protein